jgi:hypothetical protein
MPLYIRAQVGVPVVVPSFNQSGFLKVLIVLFASVSNRCRLAIFSFALLFESFATVSTSTSLTSSNLSPGIVDGVGGDTLTIPDDENKTPFQRTESLRT